MKTLERTAVILGIIGLIADVIGISTFLNGLKNSDVDTTSLQYQILYEFILFYSWLLISFFFFFRMLKGSNVEDLYRRLTRIYITIVTVGTGLLLLPFPIAISLVLESNYFGYFMGFQLFQYG